MLAKAPVPGKVKTRLCPPASPAQAARIAAAAFLDTVDAVLAVPDATPVVALTGDLAQAIDGEVLTEQLRATIVLPQRGTTLGQRIAAAYADTAAVVGDRPVLQIGMDTPQVGAKLLSRCLDLLDGDGVDAALGMATDGGWWVLGVRRPE
ncbi:MAG: TIGR04282 family arsenosugar biosynthesis glycosyltransferase, partial [Pseudonocardiaceae bacterium]